MLVLKRLEVEGFGPFVGPEVIEIPHGHGVVVVYGENGRGKTFLLNAIRYAFFGEALGRGARRRQLKTLCNRERAAEGIYEFSVTLSFTYDDDDYELARTCRSSVIDPQTNADFELDTLLRRNAAVLGPGERARALEIIFPKEISRFFLFDGELLQEYEELLINESVEGQKISEAIERILGVPILKRGKQHLSSLADEARSAAAHEAGKEKRTQAIGAAQSTALELKKQHQLKIDELEEKRIEFEGRRSEVESYLASVERYRALLDKKQRAESDLRDAQEAQSTGEESLRLAMSSAWRTVLRQRVRKAQTEVRDAVQDAIERLDISNRSRAIESGHCDTCDQDLSVAHADALRSTIPQLQDNPEAIRESLATAVLSLTKLSQFEVADNSSEIEGAWNQVQTSRIAQVVLAEEIAEYESTLEESSIDEIRKAKASQTELTEMLLTVRKGIEEEQLRVAEVEQSIARLTRELEEAGSPNVLESQSRAALLNDAAEVLAAAVDRYKADLRAGVQTTASDLFLSMISEKEDYASLRINESYGLEIIHRDGRSEEARSAGQEHVVALALMGALQGNAPLRGPIVMDSPFGRLDEMHTSNVVKTLPAMADQVVLLVYEAEVGPERVRSLLGDRLRAEYRLERVSSRHTRIIEIN